MDYDKTFTTGVYLITQMLNVIGGQGAQGSVGGRVAAADRCLKHDYAPQTVLYNLKSNIELPDGSILHRQTECTKQHPILAGRPRATVGIKLWSDLL